MKIESLSVDFTDEQKRYLEGFTTGLQISRVGRGLGGARRRAPGLTLSRRLLTASPVGRRPSPVFSS